MISAYLYLLMTLTDFNCINPFKDQTGWALVSTIFLSAGVNLGKAAFDFCLEVKHLIKKSIDSANSSPLPTIVEKRTQKRLKMKNLSLFDNSVYIEDLTVLPEEKNDQAVNDSDFRIDIREDTKSIKPAQIASVVLKNKKKKKRVFSLKKVKTALSRKS